MTRLPGNSAPCNTFAERKISPAAWVIGLGNAHRLVWRPSRLRSACRASTRAHGTPRLRSALHAGQQPCPQTGAASYAADGGSERRQHTASRNCESARCRSGSRRRIRREVRRSTVILSVKGEICRRRAPGAFTTELKRAVNSLSGHTLVIDLHRGDRPHPQHDLVHHPQQPETRAQHPRIRSFSRSVTPFACLAA